MNEQALIQDKLRSDLNDIQQRKPFYSMRAYAKKLDLSPSALSEILNGKRRISKKMAERILSRLDLDPQEQSSIVGLFGEKPQKKEEKQHFLKSINFLKLGTDQFNMISEWQHFAILSLMETKGFKSDPTWIAKKLSIPESLAKASIDRLIRLGFIFIKNKKLVTNKQALLTTDNIPNQAVRKSHYQDLALAEQALDHCPVTERDFTAITIAANKKNLPKARKMIREFQDQLTLCLEEGEKDEVFKFTFYLYPLTDRKLQEETSA